MKEYGFTVDHVVARALALLGRSSHDAGQAARRRRRRHAGDAGQGRSPRERARPSLGCAPPASRSSSPAADRRAGWRCWSSRCGSTTPIAAFNGGMFVQARSRRPSSSSARFRSRSPSEVVDYLLQRRARRLGVPRRRLVHPRPERAPRRARAGDRPVRADGDRRPAQRPRRRRQDRRRQRRRAAGGALRSASCARASARTRPPRVRSRTTSTSRIPTPTREWSYAVASRLLDVPLEADRDHRRHAQRRADVRRRRHQHRHGQRQPRRAAHGPLRHHLERRGRIRQRGRALHPWRRARRAGNARVAARNARLSVRSRRRAHPDGEAARRGLEADVRPFPADLVGSAWPAVRSVRSGSRLHAVRRRQAAHRWCTLVSAVARHSAARGRRAGAGQTQGRHPAAVDARAWRRNLRWLRALRSRGARRRPAYRGGLVEQAYAASARRRGHRGLVRRAR